MIHKVQEEKAPALQLTYASPNPTPQINNIASTPDSYTPSRVQSNIAAPPMLLATASNKTTAPVRERSGSSASIGSSDSEDSRAKAQQIISIDTRGEMTLNDQLDFVVCGATGDLSLEKIFPSLFSLYILDMLPRKFTIVGAGRTALTTEDFQNMINKRLGQLRSGKGSWEILTKMSFSEFMEKKEGFFKRVFYYAITNYNVQDGSLVGLDELLKMNSAEGPANRIFHLAIPPSAYVRVAQAIHKSSLSAVQYRHLTASNTFKDGFSRIIVEKPFGRDTPSFVTLMDALSGCFNPEDTFFMDHYAAKEMVENIPIFRFQNIWLEPLWNHKYISSVSITVKESEGIAGRGSYFDDNGVIRDMLQNHLMQILVRTAMEPPQMFCERDIRESRMTTVENIRPLTLDDVVLGQYEGYHNEDESIPSDSITPTYVCAVVFIDNDRWRGVPFILRTGKMLNERKAEVRVQFKKADNFLLGAQRNELVFRIQPDEAIYFKVNNRLPGFDKKVHLAELDLTYKKRYAGTPPEAYSKLIQRTIQGDQFTFTTPDEIKAIWEKFTPLLHQIEREKIKPITYKAKSRGPVEGDQLAKRHGFQHDSEYSWTPQKQ
ncbi:glucose 6-phosphate-1-dehydrogenase [Planoprotostelium fungivorum]|uniref:Glucose-6-phosphate 1-dehydrogenase n=1 Tax=Planoprotostelium fungivorum TaxID=1890364 RepID=A0A2P6N3M9_9EUKA|nr:glucose 6-phosphate-1-dehydrogenase [Planoprotostelium fungivorum]